MKTEEINIRDPFVLPYGGTYYLYGTRGPTCWGKADGFDVYTGNDLENWSGPAVCFRNGGTFWADRNYWAPEVHVWRGAFYMFASFKAEGKRRGTAILRAEDPAGPFRPWSDGCVTPPEWECLDGTFYISEEGVPYIVFCHEWVQAGNGEILAAPLTRDLKRAASPPALLFRASDAPWSLPVRHTSGLCGTVTDGPFLFRTRTGTLLCLWSGFSAGGYTQGLAVSRSGEIGGPFGQAEPLFRENSGHGMVFRTADGRLLLALHTPNEHLKEHPVFVPLRETEDGLLAPL